MLYPEYNKQYKMVYRGSSVFQEYEKLIQHCEAGTSKEVMEQLLKCEFDGACLRRKFLIRENATSGKGAVSD